MINHSWDIFTLWNIFTKVLIFHILFSKLGLSQNIAEKNIDIEASLKNIDKLSSENDSKRALLTVKTNKFQQKKMLPSNSEKFKPQPEEIIIDDDEDDIQVS